MAKDITLKNKNGETRYPKSVTDLIFENGTGKTLQTIITELRTADTETNTRTRMFKADVTNLDTLNKKTDIGLYNYVGNGWRGAVSINYDSADNVSQVALSSSTPSYSGNTLTWLSAQPCAMARTYINGAWTHWEKVGAPVINDLTTGGTDKALSAEMGKSLKTGLDELGLKISEGVGDHLSGATEYVIDVSEGDYFAAISETKFTVYVSSNGSSWTYYGRRPDNSLNAFIYVVPNGIGKIRLYNSSVFKADVIINKYYYSFIEHLLAIDNKFISELDGVEYSGDSSYNINVNPGNFFIAISTSNFLMYSGPNSSSYTQIGRKQSNPLNAAIYEIPQGVYSIKLYFEENFSVRVIPNSKTLFEIYRAILESFSQIDYLRSKKIDAFSFYGSTGPTNLLYTYPAVSGYVDSGGAINSSQNYDTSDFIEVLPNTTYALSYIRFSLQLDETKTRIVNTYIDHNNAASATITTVAGARYLRVSYLKNNKEKAQVVLGNSVPAYSQYRVYVPFLKIPYENIENVSVPISNIKNVTPSTNLFDKNDVVSGYLTSQGSITSNDAYRTSQLIPVLPNTVYSFAFARFVCEYDITLAMVPNTYADKNSAKSSSITTSATTSFVRVSYQTTNVYKSQMNIGTSVLPYEESGFKLPSVIYPKSKFEGKTVVCFGDSITGSVDEQEHNNWCMYLRDATGMNVINQGYWSGRVAYADDAAAVVNAFAFYKLIDAVISGDWSDQDIIYSTSGYEQHAAQLDKLKQIDFSTVDFLTIALGTNDLASNTPFEIENEPMSVESVNGAFRYTISRLLTNFPYLKIAIMTPIYRFTPLTGEDYMVGGRGVQSFVDDYKELGKELHIPVVDMFNDIGVNKYNRVYYWGANGGDGLHPIYTMKELMGNKVAGFLLSTY